jgi:type II pantothenate kinase
MPRFPLLSENVGYRPCRWDLRKDTKQAAYWLELFRRHFPKLIAEAVKQAAHDKTDTAEFLARLAKCQADFIGYVNDLEARRPTCWNETFESLDILTICEAREKFLRAAGVADPYRLAKANENRTALSLLPGLLAELDTTGESELPLLIAQGVFAGNIYDLGAVKTLELFEKGKVDFRAVRAKLKPRPWLIDDLNSWIGRLHHREPHGRALLFIDNAGPDLILGMLPFARFLIDRGTKVVIAANTTPALNDVTYPELIELLPEVFAIDGRLGDAWADGRLTAVPSGCGTPLIDLSRVSEELVESVNREPVDLVVLEGMGRGIESNFDASLKCECIKTAMIKDPGVAQSMNGEVYDLVFRYEP